MSKRTVNQFKSHRFLQRSFAIFVRVTLVLVLSIQLSGIAIADVIDVHEATLSSGQKVYVQEIHTNPIVTISTWVNTGSAQEVAENNGVSHFLEHLLFKGTETYKTGEIDRILESRGATFNAATSRDFTYYYITTSRPHLEEALRLHAEMLLNANMPVPELDRERKVVQEEINRALDNPSRKLYITLSELLYPGHPYSLDTLGPKAVIGGIPREKILEYYHQWYQPQNFKTVIVGDVEADEAVSMVDKAFQEAYKKDSSRSTPSTPKFHPIPDRTNPESQVITDTNTSLAHFNLAFPVPSIEDRQTNYALDVAAIALGQGKSSRLYQELKEKRQLVTEIGAANSTQQQSGIFYISAEMEPDKRDAAKKATLEVLNQFKAEGITQEELNKAKNQIIKSYAFSTESTEGVASSIGYNVTIGELSDYTHYVQNIQSVSVEDVNKAINQWLDLDKAVLAELLPEKPGQNLEQLAAANESLLQTNAQSQPRSGNNLVAQDKTDTKAEVSKVMLPNGATLLLKPVADSKTVAIHLFAKGGQLIEKKPGIAPLAARLITKETKNRSAESMSSQIDKLGLSLQAGSDDDYFEIKGASVSEDLGQLLLFLEDILHHPTFDPQQMEKERADILTQIKASRDIPSNLAFENLTEALYPNHPYGAVGEELERSLPTITRQDIIDYYQTQMQPENLVIAVVGNFDPEIARSSLSQVISHLPKAPSHVKVNDLPNVPPLKETEVVKEQKPEQAAVWVTNGWLAPPISADKDYVALKVINTLLGEGMSSRLFVNLREKQGLAYQVGTMYPSSMKKSRFVMYIGTDPANEEKVQQGFNQQIQWLQQTPLDPQELERAKKKLIGSFALNHESNANQAFYLGLYETLGVGYQYDELYPQLVEQVTVTDIQEAARNIFAQPRVISKVVPEKVRTETP